MARLKAYPKTYQQAVNALGNKDSIKLGNNTYLERDCADCISVRLHQTDIVNFFADGRITLRTGGWYKKTTKNRLNEFITGRVFQKDHTWFYVGHNSTGALDWNHPQPFVEGMNVGSVQPDFEIQNEGTIYLLHPNTQAAQEWVEENLPADVQRFGGAVVVEHRYICDIIDGIRRDGLEVR